MKSKTSILMMTAFLLTLSSARPAFSEDFSKMSVPLGTQPLGTQTYYCEIDVAECTRRTDAAVTAAQAAADAQLAQVKADAAAELAAAERKWKVELEKAVLNTQNAANNDKAQEIARLTSLHTAELDALRSEIANKALEIDTMKAAQDAQIVAAAAKEQDLLRAHCFEPQETDCAEVTLDDAWVAQYCNSHLESLQCQARSEQAAAEMRAAIEAAGYPTGAEQIKFCRMNREMPECGEVATSPH